MTYEELFKKYKYYSEIDFIWKCFDENIAKEKLEELELELKAIEKQIPKKPIFKNDECYCPVCNKIVGFKSLMESGLTNYCGNCGQKVEVESNEKEII